MSSNLHEEAEEHEGPDDGDGGADEGGGLPDGDAAVEAPERRVEARVEPGGRVGVVELRLRGRVSLRRCNAKQMKRSIIEGKQFTSTIRITSH